ncbi:nuclease-related domain-containing protein [Heyndrickxia vini]|uniref:NERD domain-containing protein n=1 Tax=Heyndrickxia vini TaxID=1476025 RepID=A0ABX7E355_9BACI|nr:nuclease-related domain-containing protein [Heyndrickxia vini]QQZ10128.1 NERD domain-containing protein [Heyndrickxia vini]
MFAKSRCESEELMFFKYLYFRMTLSDKELSYYLTLKKGYEGEKRFDQWLEKLSSDCLILNDLLFEYNNNVFQIDSLVLTSNIIHFFEVKNFEGDYYIENEKWYSLNGKEIKNPMLQLNRNTSLFRRILQDLGISIPIKPHLIFVNPNFYLYHAPVDLPITFPPQIDRLITSINMTPSNVNSKHMKLVNQLLSMHMKKSPFMRIPNYTFEQLRKGITCAHCHSFIQGYKKALIICTKCGFREKIASAIVRCVEEYSFLFPERKITSKSIHEWCEIPSSKTVQAVLSTNFKQIGNRRSSYYVSKNNQ